MHEGINFTRDVTHKPVGEAMLAARLPKKHERSSLESVLVCPFLSNVEKKSCNTEDFVKKDLFIKIKAYSTVINNNVSYFQATQNQNIPVHIIFNFCTIYPPHWIVLILKKKK